MMSNVGPDKTPQTRGGRACDIRVLNVAETAKGGIATYLNMLPKLGMNGIDWKFIVQDTHREHLDINMDVTTFQTGSRRAFNPFRLFLCAKKICRDYKPDIIIFHSTFTLPAMALLKMLRVPAKFIYCPHGWATHRYEQGSFKYRAMQVFEKYASGFADVVMNISKHDAAYAREAEYRGKHIVVENAVESLTTTPEGLDMAFGDKPLRLLFVGRFDRQKGLDILLEAFTKARVARPEIELSIIGESVRGDEKIELINSDGITLHGWVPPDKLAEHYARADILIVPSRWEGFGLIVAESMRSGTPVLVSDRGNLPDMIEEGKTGLIVPLTNDDFTKALTKLDKDKIRAMRPACLETYTKRFHQNRFKSDLATLFDDLSILPDCD